MLAEPIDVTNVQMYLHVIWPIESDAVTKLELGDAGKWRVRIIDQLQQRCIYALVSQMIDDLMAEAIVGHCRDQRYIKPQPRRCHSLPKPLAARREFERICLDRSPSWWDVLCTKSGVHHCATEDDNPAGP